MVVSGFSAHILIAISRSFATMSLRVRSFALAACAALGLGASARADFILDDFSNPSTGAQFVIANSNSNPFPVTTNLAGGTVRSAVFTVTSPTPAGPFSLLGVIGGGTVDMFFDSTSSGNAVISYTFGTPLDFSTLSGSTGSVRLTTQSAASLGNPNVGFTLSLLSGVNALSTTGSFLNSAGFIDQDVTFSSLAGTGNLSQVTGLTLTINAQTADDFRLDKIALSETTVVPAPPAALLALAALPVFGLRRYFAKKA